MTGFCINRKNNGNALTIRGKRVWENEKEKKHVYHFMYVNGSCCGNCARNRKGKGGPTAAGNCRKILRFHVLANSDAKDDQNVKLKVRDAVGHMLGQKLKKVTDRAQTEKIVQDHMDEIIETAEKTLHKNGYTYGASARLANVDFPVKTYGDYTFPAGKYRALQITLGKGEGHNWWCVLYPNMCFQGSVYEVMDESSGEELREVLTQEEYADVFDSGKMQIRWKFLDYFR